MQLFILDTVPGNAARMLCDCHLRKMCLETAQILSAVIINSGQQLADGMPLPCNPHHPVITAIVTPSRINWVIRCNEGLHREYRFRFGKNHAYCGLSPEYRKKLFTVGIIANCTGLARCFKNFHTEIPDLIAAHREYYRFKKSLLSNWHYTRREEPAWLKNNIIN